MLAALTILLVCQLIGEAAVEAFDLPIPGPVIGMALLFIALCLRGAFRQTWPIKPSIANPSDRGPAPAQSIDAQPAVGTVPRSLEHVARSLLEHLSLLFVPAGVGVVLHLDLVAAEWVPVTAALIGSTVITIAVTALVMRLLDTRSSGGGSGDGA